MSLPAARAPAFREPGLWASVWKLLRLRVLISFNTFRRAKIGQKIGTIFAILGLLVFLGFILFISIVLLRFLRSPELAGYIGDVTPLLESFPVMLVSVSAVGILVTGFGVLLQALYLSGDMDFLMTAPIPIRAVFISKLVQALLPNFGILCLFTLPLLYGLGASAGYNFLFYPLVLVVLIVLTLAAASLASLLVMVAARYFPARRLAEVLGAVVGTAFFLFSQTSRFMDFDMNAEQVTGMLALAERFNQPWSPLYWAGRGLVLLGEGNWLPAIGLLGAALLLTGGIFYIALATSERLYYTGWSSLQNNRKRKKDKAATPVPAGRSRTGFRLPTLFPAPIRAILVKDLISYRRDLRSISQIITPLILGVVYAISLIQSGGRVDPGQGRMPPVVMEVLQGVLLYGDVALALFLGWMLAANMAGVGFSMEGKSYWMLKSAPLTSRQLLTAKYLVAYLPSFALCAVYVIILQILKAGSLWSVVVSLLAVALSLAGLVGIYLAFGVRGARFDWDNPQQKSLSVGCLGSLVGFIFLPICFVFFIGPALAAALLDFPPILGQIAGLVLGGAVSLAAAILPLEWVVKRVGTLNEA